MKRSLQYLFLILVIISSLGSCKKEDAGGEPELIAISEAIKPYMFKKDTYWIYKRENPLSIDTIQVVSVDTGYFWSELAINGSNGVKAQDYQMNLNSTQSGTNQNYYIAFDYMRKNGGGYYGEFGQPILFAGHNQGYGFSGAVVDSLLPELTVNGILYSNVIRMFVDKETQYQQEYQNDTRLYFVPGIGLIRKDIIKSGGEVETWFLIGEHIVN